ncbi:MAG: hypothetical protein H7233_07175 [Pseudorhodobacter sp.]|nr:hypothetical protein [Frankiaceae bacterium]
MTTSRALTMFVLPAALFALAAPATAAAAPDDVPGFGVHVFACAQSMGFGGSHNPGMHHGAAGWDGMPC